MFKVKYVDSIMMLVRLDLNLIVSLLQHKCDVSETVSTTTLFTGVCFHTIYLFTLIKYGCFADIFPFKAYVNIYVVVFHVTAFLTSN